MTRMPAMIKMTPMTTMSTMSAMSAMPRTAPPMTAMKPTNGMGAVTAMKALSGVVLALGMIFGTILGAGALLAPGLAAQQVASAASSGSILTLLPVEDRDARARAELLGELREADMLVPGGQRVQAWSFEGGEGESIRIDLTSSDFDAYLYLVGPGLGSGLSDDDGGSGLNSRLCAVLPTDGRYRVVAASLGGDTGRYSLSLGFGSEEGGGQAGCDDEAGIGGNEASDLSVLAIEGREAEVGNSYDGLLSVHGPTYLGSPVQAWALPAEAGREFTIDLRSSDFDAYLQLVGPGLGDALTDDDGAGGCDARITFTAPEEGVYRVVVSSLGSTGGAFTLSLHDDPPPAETRPCIPVNNSTGSPDDGGELSVHGSVALGETMRGALGEGSGAGAATPGSGADRWRGGPVQVWSLDGHAGDRIRIDLHSSDFDAYLGLDGPGFDTPLTNDDGGDGLDARLCLELPEDGTYRILAGTFSSSASGGYSLEIGPVEDAPCGTLTLSPEQRARVLDATEPTGRLAPESEVEGTLAPGGPVHPERGAPMEIWTLEGEAGGTLTVDLVSSDFDAYLYLGGPGLPEILSDDDGAGCLDSRITITFPESGTYRVLATGLSESASGSYRLMATSQPENNRACETPGMRTGGTSTVSSAILDGILVPEVRTLSRPVVPTLSRRDGGVISQIAGLQFAGRLTMDDVQIGEGRPAHGWGVEARAGDRLLIELLSGDFDANLYLDGPGLGEAFHDDDGAGGLDSRLDVTVPEDGNYRIVVTSNSGGEGAYTLRVLRQVGRN